MKIVIDISAIAKAARLDEEEILRELSLDKPRYSLAEWILLVRTSEPGTLDFLRNLLGLTSHFFKRE